MSDLEEVSDSELIEKMDDDEPTFPIKLSKKKKVSYNEKYDDDEEDYQSENDSDEEEDDDRELGSIKLGGGNDDDGEGEGEGESDVEGESEGEGEGKEEESIETSASASSGSASSKKSKDLPIPLFESGDDDEDDDEEDETYLQKFDKDIRDDFITSFHPESKSHNYEEIKALARITRNSSGIVYDALHKTLPFLTKYEMTRVLGQRARQINAGGKSFVVVPPNIMDGYLIARMELEQKKLPFIIKRPIPNGGFEYWNVSDLELL